MSSSFEAPSPDFSYAERDDWRDAWGFVVDSIGTDFAPAEVTASHEVDTSLILRYLEPIEFDCPLHYDEDIARAHGYRDIIAPYSGLATWLSAGEWRPGAPPAYVSDEPNDLPPSVMETGSPIPGPPTNSIIATDIETEYFRPVARYDLLTKRGRVLIACVPKETRVGRGAYLTWDAEAWNQDHELVARVRMTSFAFVARDRGRGEPSA